MHLRDKPQGLTAAQRIKDQIGLDVRDDAAVGRVLEACQARRIRARRLAAGSGALAAAIIIAWIAASMLGRVHGFELVLLPVLLIINGLRLVSAVVTARRLARVRGDIEAARAQAAAAPPPARGIAGARPSPDVARWN